MSFTGSYRKLIAASVALLLLACSDATAPLAPSQEPAVHPNQSLTSTLGGVTGTVTSVVNGLLLQCTPQAYVKVTAQIGPAGGTINFGHHQLEIPRGALSAPVMITAEALAEAGNAVRFQPEGLKFAVGAPLHLSYANCRDNLLGLKSVVYTNDLLAILERLLTVDNRTSKEVVAPLRHFSRYAVAW
jgi:hypothetical protein